MLTVGAKPPAHSRAFTQNMEYDVAAAVPPQSFSRLYATAAAVHTQVTRMEF